jgi:hypothetical protein
MFIFLEGLNMRTFIKTVSVALTAALLMTSCARIGNVSGNADEAWLKVKATELKSTVITPHLEEKILSGKNLLYCSSFQLAWNELWDNIIKDKISLQDNPQIAQVLNKRSVDKTSISEESYLAMSGYGKDDIVNKINDALKQKFGDEAWKVENKLNPDDIIAYAFMFKNLEFEKEFEKIKEPLNFGGTKVSAFGIESSKDKTEDIRKQVNILDYKSDNDFVIELKSKSDKDEIILAKVSPEENLMKTYYSIQTRIKGEKNLESDYSKLIIPKFNFDISKNYEELEKKDVLNKGFEDYLVEEASQRTRFKLDEKGVVLKSEGKIILTKSAAPVMKNLIFDKPFMLILKEKNSEVPYFVMWVDNAELMVK